MPFDMIPGGWVLRILTGPLISKKWIKGSHNISVLLGLYEAKQTHCFYKLSKNKKVFWDLGAHVGYYTLLFKTANVNGLVFAFEPLPSNRYFFQKHVQLNKISEVHFFNKAVSNEKGKLRFNTGKSTVAGKIDDRGDIAVEVIQLSNYLTLNKIVEPDIIKMDIEGEEFKVLQDLEGILAHKKPVIFLSTHSDKVHEKSLNLLLTFNYKLKPLDSADLYTAREVLCQ